MFTNIARAAGPFLLLTGLLLAAPAIAADSPIIPGCAVIHFATVPSWQSADLASSAPTGYAPLDAALKSMEVRSFRHEFGPVETGYRVLRYDPEIPFEVIQQAFAPIPGILAVEPDIARPVASYTRRPNDFLLPAQWHHEAINSLRGWGIVNGSDDVVIGIIDSGVEYIHPDLAPIMWVNEAEDLNGDGTYSMYDMDLEDNDGNGYIDDVLGYDWVDISTDLLYPGEDGAPQDSDPADFGGHGTHCAGDAGAAGFNHIGVTSAGSGCRIAALRAGYTGASGQGYVGLSAATSAVYYAINMDFNVLSMSFGGSGSSPSYFFNAMQAAADSGIVLLGAAGNESSSTPSYPAANPFVIAVASSQEGNTLSTFSNYGDWVTITSPGTQIRSTQIGLGYGNMDGTSMACPVAAGVVAQLKALRPEWGYDEIVARLSETAQPMNQYGTGAGLIDFGAAVDMFVSVDSLWTVNANDGNRLHFDETGTLGIRWHKRDGSATNVLLELSNEDERIYLETEAFTIGDVSGGESGTCETEITISSGSLNLETFEFNATISGSDENNEFFTYNQVLTFRVGAAQALVINADQGGKERIDYWLQETLETAEYEVEVIVRDDIQDLPSLLDEYDMVITLTGTAETDLISSDDYASYASYVAQGGHWLPSGQNVAQDLATSSPLTLDTLFHVDYIAEHANRLAIHGIDEQELTADLYLVMAGPGGAWNQTSMDVLNAREGATPLFVYNPDTPDELGGVLIRRGLGEIAYCAFGLEGINDSTQTASKREDFLIRLFTHWGNPSSVQQTTDGNTPDDFTFKNLWPNPTNGFVTLDFSLSHTGIVTFTLYDILGREILMRKNHYHPGSHSLSLELPPQLASGQYFIRVAGRNAQQVRTFTLIK